MARRRGDGAEDATWGVSALVAATWAVVLTLVSIALFFLEETYLTTNRAFNAVLVLVTAAFAAAPLVAGSLHRSRRVRVLTLLCCVVGLLVSLTYASWAYSSIGGGP